MSKRRAKDVSVTDGKNKIRHINRKSRLIENAAGVGKL
jgi:hypothetical protein